MSDPLRLASVIEGRWKDLDFRPFRDGVDIYPICDGTPAVALLRYAPGTGVPAHTHTGLETILVLEGEQIDECGRYPAGTLVLNPAGTSHSVWTETGCVVLIQWERPVAFIAGNDRR